MSEACTNILSEENPRELRRLATLARQAASVTTAGGRGTDRLLRQLAAELEGRAQEIDRNRLFGHP